MPNRPTHFFFVALALLVLQPALLGGATPAFGAEPSSQTERKQGDADANPYDLVQGTHVEGHIAFLKAEIGITTSQEQMWEPVAEAMREDVRTLQETDARLSKGHSPANAVEYLQNRVTFADLRAQGEARFLAAFQPLYSSLSKQQRRIADELFIPDMD